MLGGIPSDRRICALIAQRTEPGKWPSYLSRFTPYDKCVSGTNLDGLKAKISARLFRPGPFDFLFNPVYLIRRPLYLALKSRAAGINGKVLDFGCGSMPYKALFTRASEYTGLDMENSEHGLSQPDVVFDGQRIPFPKNSFDSVVMFEVLDDLATPAVQLAEIRRVLRTKGTLLLTTSFVWELHEEPYDIARYTHHGLDALLTSNGFEVQEIHRLGHYRRVMGQMAAMYWYQTLQKLPLGIIPGVAIAAVIQFFSLLTEKLLPQRKELWLTNLVIATKK